MTIPSNINMGGDACIEHDPLMGISITALFEGALDQTDWSHPESLWEPPDADELKRLFPAHEIQCLLGRGGMGVVYKAFDTVLRKTVAIKLLPPALASNEQLVARFKREAHVMNALDHPGIVKVHTFVQTGDGHAYFVMDYVEGKTIHELVAAKEISVRRTLRLVVQICKALHYLHGRGVIHRDIKPSNIIVDLHGNARLLDFGIAGQMPGGTENLTLTGQNPGTPFYMAPELQRGEPPTASSDIYSLGVTFYEMLTGERPHIQTPRPSSRSAADSSIDKVVFRALKPQPAARYQDADQMRRDIERCFRASKEFRQALILAGILVPATVAFCVWVARPERPAAALGHQALLAGYERSETAPPAPEIEPQLPAPSTANPIPTGPNTAAPSAASGKLTMIKPDKENPFVNSLGMRFVPVPGTHVLFSIWETRVRDYAGFSGKSRPSVVWKTIQNGSVPVPQNDDDPIVFVNRNSAKAYCEWLTQKETKEGIIPKGARYRLPTDLEWSAAVGLPEEEGATPRQRSDKAAGENPWGGSFPPLKPIGNYCDATYVKEVLTEPRTPIPNYDDGFATTAPVGSFPPNSFGIYDLGGNVGEWCADDYDLNDKRCVIRGGNFFDAVPDNLRASHRDPWKWETTSFVWHGFRCVLDLSAAGSTTIQPDHPEKTSAAPEKAHAHTDGFAGFEGTWTVEFKSGHVHKYQINGSGKVRILVGAAGERQLYRIGNDVMLDFAAGKIERLGFTGDKLLVEHWHPAAYYSKGNAAGDVGTSKETRSVRELVASDISRPTQRDPSTPNPLEAFKTLLQGHEWSYEDSLYPGSNEQPPSPMVFHPNGKFHEKWKWNYWIAAPGVLHVQFWDAVYQPESAVVLNFNEARTAYSGEFKDSKGRLHKLTGTRLSPIR